MTVIISLAGSQSSRGDQIQGLFPGLNNLSPPYRTLLPSTDSSLHSSPSGSEAGCSQEEGPKKGFVMGSRAQGVQEILEKYM